jgi:hypothetical protein
MRLPLRTTFHPGHHGTLLATSDQRGALTLMRYDVGAASAIVATASGASSGRGLN